MKERKVNNKKEDEKATRAIIIKTLKTVIYAGA